MEELQLVRPAPEHIEELQKFRQELLEAGDEDSFAGCSRLEHYEDVREWMEMVWRQEQEVDPGKVTVCGPMSVARAMPRRCCD